MRLSKNRFEDEYFEWLISIISYSGYEQLNLSLLKTLHKKEFKVLIPHDDNRAYEGKNLRETYCDEVDFDYDYATAFYGIDVADCSMLELIIGLSIRCEQIIADNDIGGWFWRFLENIRLDRFSDDEFYDNGGAVVINNILDMIIKRQYKKNGYGGLFPLKLGKADQRKVEIWYQMCAYLDEHYNFRD